MAWSFLSIGLVLGGRWAYDVLGWGGFWGWDPVENAMLMPWLTGTAFLHSVMIQEKRGMLKVWNMILIILTYSLILFGTFITRTGVISSVHSFAKSALGPVFFAFIGLTFIWSLSLLFRRMGTLRAGHEVESLLSRESIFLLQNVLFLSITFAVFWGTVFPMISELITGTRITVGPPFYTRVTGPLFAALVILMAIAPFFAWRKQPLRTLDSKLLIPALGSIAAASAWWISHRQHPDSFFALWVVSFVVVSILYEIGRGVRARVKSRGEGVFTAIGRLVGRDRRRYGGYLIHLAVIMIGMGFIGDAFFKVETQGTVSVGEHIQIEGYKLRYDGLSQYMGEDGREVLEASVSLFNGDEFVKVLSPRRDYFVVQRQPVTIPGVYSSFKEDVYVLLVGWEEIGMDSSTFKVYVNPLINWTWIGGLLLAVGAIIAAWPGGGIAQQRSYAIRPRSVESRATAGD